MEKEQKSDERGLYLSNFRLTQQPSSGARKYFVTKNAIFQAIYTRVYETSEANRVIMLK